MRQSTMVRWIEEADAGAYRCWASSHRTLGEARLPHTGKFSREIPAFSESRGLALVQRCSNFIRCGRFAG